MYTVGRCFTFDIYLMQGCKYSHKSHEISYARQRVRMLTKDIFRWTVVTQTLWKAVYHGFFQRENSSTPLQRAL